MYHLSLLLSVSSEDVVEEVLYAVLLNLVCANFKIEGSVEFINKRNTFVTHLMYILGSSFLFKSQGSVVPQLFTQRGLTASSKQTSGALNK
jgi:hypothetical protein